MDHPSPDLTLILKDVACGRRERIDTLLSALYDDLKRLAAHHLGDAGAPTLQATVLVHEAWIRLIDQRQVEWRDRAHFLAVASRIIRRVLVDHVRARNAAKRGRDRQRLLTTGLLGSAKVERVDLVDLDEALRELARIDARQAEIVELRFFGGLTMDEIAEVTGAGKRSVDREWACAKAWLYRELAPEENDPLGPS